MSIGYACLTAGVLNTEMKKCTLKNLNEEKLLSLISNNLNSLENIIDYNIENNIKLFRISSDLIPFGSSPVNNVNWWEIFDEKFSAISKKIKNSNMRVSMHPGQYTVLNSVSDEVVHNAILDLNYHTKVLDSLGIGPENKIVLHIGGIYGDKRAAVDRFVLNYQKLSDKVKGRLVIENDDKSYNICDVLEIGNKLNVPVIYDNLHNFINPCDKNESDNYWINECSKTWKKGDGNQKIHYSQQNSLKKSGSHSKTIFINEFMDFYNKLSRNDIDLMLEVKDKNISALKCINCISQNKNIKVLEKEWSKYKYFILENSPNDYLEIRKLLKNKNNYPAVEFYNLIEHAVISELTVGNSINALEHVWGYFKDLATDNEKKSFFNSLEKYKNNLSTIKTVKNLLMKMAVKYNETYLLSSYYFYSIY